MSTTTNSAHSFTEGSEVSRQYEYSAQKGKPGHCYIAQIFKNGKAFISIEPTEDERDATETAIKITNFLNHGN